jgi:hypothetical protein
LELKTYSNYQNTHPIVGLRAFPFTQYQTYALLIKSNKLPTNLIKNLGLHIAEILGSALYVDAKRKWSMITYIATSNMCQGSEHNHELYPGTLSLTTTSLFLH